MKKWILRLVLALVVVSVLAIVVVALCLDGIVKKGVETAGPRVTKVDVKLDAASISLLSGSAKLKGLLVGNPSGYTTPAAIKVGTISVALKPMSVLSDKIVIDSINIQSPEITLEGGLANNNLFTIQKNVAGPAASGPAAAKAENGTQKKLQVTDLVISGAILYVKSPLLAGQTASVTLPDIHITNLGTGSDGITPAELTEKVLSSLMTEVIPAVTKLAGNLGAEAVKLGKGAEKKGQDALNKVLGGLRKSDK